MVLASNPVASVIRLAARPVGAHSRRLVPFAARNYRPVWVGLGQIGLYTWVIVTLSFYIRKRLGQKNWRAVHYLSYASFLSLLVHGIFSGTDSSLPWVQVFYWFSGAALLFLTIYRILLPRLGETKGKTSAGLRSTSRSHP